MSIRSTLLAATVVLASFGAAHAEGLKPIAGQSIRLADISGVAYYTVEPTGYRVVTTLAQGEAGAPIRVVSLLTPGQRVVLSTPTRANVLEISRAGDSLVIRDTNAVAN
ncbi:hypothetical protein [Bradyrhizobium sp. F1.13.3]|uniref:hypothetical protein n=1 Tax=Bradyrhizobium sp. F1.13.3 TaxID=3156351 RepID=UPI00339AC751